MARPIKIFRCSKCDAQFPKWEGRCRDCGEWGSLVEDTVMPIRPKSQGTVVSLNDVTASGPTERLSSQSTEFDRVLGGGFVPGALILLGGDPGVGKSTLLLQVARNLSVERNGEGALPVLYVSGEESAEQVRHRLDRLGPATTNLKFLGEPSVTAIEAAIQNVRPKMVVVDSLQTIREDGEQTAKTAIAKRATEELMILAKRTHVPIILIGHVTKSGAVAGPKTIEHLVDAVLYFERGAGGAYRILRAVKNRFGGVSEIGVWHMSSRGLEEVANPSAIFLTERTKEQPGSCVTAIVEGSRVFLVEVQALVNKTKFGYPQRRVTGFDNSRLQLLLAVLAQRLKLPLAYYDVHLNVVGGLKIVEPAADMAVALAITSALKNVPVSDALLAVGEIGLQGEVRGIVELDRRLEEAARLGFTAAITPKQEITANKKIDTYQVSSLSEAIETGLAK